MSFIVLRGTIVNGTLGLIYASPAGRRPANLLNDNDMGQVFFPARSKQFIRSTSIFLFEFFGEYKQHTDQYAIKTKNQNPFYPKAKRNNLYKYDTNKNQILFSSVCRYNFLIKMQLWWINWVSPQSYQKQ